MAIHIGRSTSPNVGADNSMHIVVDRRIVPEGGRSIAVCGRRCINPAAEAGQIIARCDCRCIAMSAARGGERVIIIAQCGGILSSKGTLRLPKLSMGGHIWRRVGRVNSVHGRARDIRKGFHAKRKPVGLTLVLIP